jgi:hypothetical protein
VESITIVHLQVAIPKLQPQHQMERALILIHKWVEFPRRGAHGIFKEGAPSGRSRLPNVRERAATSPHIPTCVKSNSRGRRVRHLLRVWAATSRVRHLSKRGAPPHRHVLKSSKIFPQSNVNQVILSPFDSFLTFAFNFSSTLSPHIFFIFDLADFY